jgi:GT2 family glycosyltransferase
VSIIVLTRDGADQMKRLLSSLERTTYHPFEVVIVDNGSNDETPDLLAVKRAFPLRVIRNEGNVSFSRGNNQGAELAAGDYLLFLNNDVEAINSGWIGALVEAVETEGVVAAGALLVYPSRGDPASDLTVQHRGIHFSFRMGAVRGFNTHWPDPLDRRLLNVLDVPAATAAALMVKAGPFRDVSGFDEGYVYGREDIDLCLKLRQIGRIVVAGNAALFHYESATLAHLDARLREVNRAKNRQRFAELWAPQLTRSVRRDRLTGAGSWTLERTRTASITLTRQQIDAGWGDYYTAHELGDALTADGWRVIYAERHDDHWYDIEEEVDLLVSLLDSYDVRNAPEGAFTVAWVRNWVDRWLDQPWFDDYDLIAVASQKAAQLLDRKSRFEPLVLPMATNPDRFHPGHPNPMYQSDYVFTGNNWGHGRSLIKILDVGPNERFMLFGKGWDKDPRVARHWRGHLEYERLPDVYRSTKIVLDDTASPTLPYAFLNGRVFDALASGALVLSDNVEGSKELFGGELPTYSASDELRTELDRYLASEEERDALVASLRERVLSRHTYAARSKEFLAAALENIDRPHAAIKIAVPDERVKATWGDTHFADALASELTGVGMVTEVQILPNWEQPASHDVDVVIHLRGLTRYIPKPAHVNVLWIISHPDDVSISECERYDMVLVASRRHADWLRPQIDAPVVFLPQATDHRRFHPGPKDPDLAEQVLFVGNSRGVLRPAVEWAIGANLPLAVYGGDWEGLIPEGYLRGPHFPNDRLSRLYGSAGVVLNDHWPDMRDHGFISNRIFDALASGAVVVTDPVAGLEEAFGGLVPTYSSPEELEEVVRSLLNDEQRRTEISSAASELVTRRHTFTDRAEKLADLVRSLLNGRPKDLDGAVWDL